MNRLLLVEDEEVILNALVRLLERNHYEVHAASSTDQARTHDLRSFDLILADLRLPGDMGTSLISDADPVPVVIMTSHASVRSAVDAMRLGAIDYIAKPFDHDELLMVIKRSLNQNLMQSQNRALKLDIERHFPLSESLKQTALAALNTERQERAASTRFIHVHGEYGTEKESVCRVIHANSRHCNGPFLIMDTSRDEHTAIEQLLGAATRAPSGGYVQAAQNGTLVIRNLELIAPNAQENLLQVVKGKRSASNLTLISISDHSIDELLATEQLHPELAQLFQPNQFEVAPLRRRAGDIKALCEDQLRRLSTQLGRKPLKLSDDALSALMANEWPGNVRELNSVLQRAVSGCRTNTINLSDVGFNSSDLSLDEYFRFFVIRNQRALSETELAARLGISRKALWERRQKMNLLRDSGDDSGRGSGGDSGR